MFSSKRKLGINNSIHNISLFALRFSKFGSSNITSLSSTLLTNTVLMLKVAGAQQKCVRKKPKKRDPTLHPNSPWLQFLLTGLLASSRLLIDFSCYLFLPLNTLIKGHDEVGSCYFLSLNLPSSFVYTRTCPQSITLCKNRCGREFCRGNRKLSVIFHHYNIFHVTERKKQPKSCRKNRPFENATLNRNVM